MLRLGQESNRLSVHMENTFDAGETGRKDRGTVKADKRNHGFGTQIIDEIVNKYEGNCFRAERDGRYVIKIQLTERD